MDHMIKISDREFLLIAAALKNYEWQDEFDGVLADILRKRMFYSVKFDLDQAEYLQRMGQE